MIHNNILDAMGNTPIIRLNKMVDDDSAEILVKFEGLNVGGSIKTRTAYNMILKAEEEGTAFETINGGRTEVLGGTLCICYRDRFPAIINRDSAVSFISSSITYAKDKMWSRIVEEHKGDETLTLTRDKFPIRFMDVISVPLYKGDLRK